MWLSWSCVLVCFVFFLQRYGSAVTNYDVESLPFCSQISLLHKLDTLARTNGTRLRVYAVYHNQYGADVIRNFSHCQFTTTYITTQTRLVTFLSQNNHDLESISGAVSKPARRLSYTTARFSLPMYKQKKICQHARTSNAIQTVIDPHIEKKYNIWTNASSLNKNLHLIRIEIKCPFVMDWIKSLSSNITKAFEYAVYRSHFPGFTDPTIGSQFIADVDYVLMSGYKSFSNEYHYLKHHNFHYTPKYILALLKFLHQSILQGEKAQVIPGLMDTISLKDSLVSNHGVASLHALNTTLLALQWSLKDIEQVFRVVPFYRNSYMTTSTVFVAIARTMQQVLTMMDHHPEIAHVYQQNAEYHHGDLKVAQIAFGKPYYELHPFVLERLICVGVYLAVGEVNHPTFIDVLKAMQISFAPRERRPIPNLEDFRLGLGMPLVDIDMLEQSRRYESTHSALGISP